MSLSYLLDFVKAVDFLDSPKIKAGLEDKIKKKINDSTWKEVFTATKDIIGLQKVTDLALGHLMKNIQSFFKEETKDLDVTEAETVSDPYVDDYKHLSPALMRQLLRQIEKSKDNEVEWIKLHLIENWIKTNGTEAGVTSLLAEVAFQDLKDLNKATCRAETWGLYQEELSNFRQRIDEVKEEKEKELARKRMKREDRSRKSRRELIILLHQQHHHHHHHHWHHQIHHALFHGHNFDQEQEQNDVAHEHQLMMQEILDLDDANMIAVDDDDDNDNNNLNDADPLV